MKFQKLNPKQTYSLWERDRWSADFAPLKKDAETEVCVIGAGITGLSCAYRLAKVGKKVMVLESSDVASGETSRTTAHLASELDDRMCEMIRIHGLEGARLAYESHAAAIDEIEKIIAEEKIECDFTRLEAYLFPHKPEANALIQKEFEACSQVGMQVSQMSRGPLPFETGPCLRFENQAQFNPLKFMKGLLLALKKMRVEIFTRTQVLEVKGGANASIKTRQGAEVSASSVIIATNTPFNDMVVLHTKQAAYRTYAIAAQIPAGSVAKALFWDTAEPYHYIRVVSSKEFEGKYDLLIVGGEDHKTGQEDYPEACFDRLISWAELHFPQIEKIAYHWSGQVMEPIDGLAFIGRNPADSPNIYVATGDSGMGITHGVIASMLLSDLILGRENPWEKIFDPSRKSVMAANRFVQENANVIWQYKDWFTAGEVDSSEDVKAGEGAIIREGLSKVAVYRDLDGLLHKRSALCPHLGGLVKWNSVEKSWDCPCHGSRFSCYGKVLHGPAAEDLHPVKFQAEESHSSSAKDKHRGQL